VRPAAICRTLLAVLAAGCGSARTEVLVWVTNSDLDIGRDIDTISLVVRDRDDGGRVYFSLGHGADQVPPTPQPLCHDGLTKGCYPLPLGIALYPGAHVEDAVEVEVTSYLGSAPKIDDRAVFHFTRDAVQRLDFFLYKSCLGTACATSDQLCGAGGACQGTPLATDGGVADGAASDLAGGADLAGRDLAPSGPAWLAAAPALDPSPVLALEVARSNPLVVYAGTQTGFYRSDDGGMTWSQNLIAGHTSPTIAVDPTDAMTVYVGGTTNLQRSTNGGTTFAPVVTSQVVNVLIDPTNRFVYAATNTQGVQYYNGSTWGALNTGLTSMTINTIGIDAVDLFASVQNSLFVLARGGPTTWQPASGTPGGSIAAFTTDGAGTLYVGGAFNGIKKSSDHGASFTTTTAQTQSYTLMRGDPTRAGVVYAGTGMGVYKTKDGGQTWFFQNGGLPASTVVDALAVDPTHSSTVYIGSRAGLIYKSTTGGE
jgi:photosystem II stability/assembly factor-like uncharacterized protein